MTYLPIPERPRIMLFANDSVGLKIAKWLSYCGEHIVAVVVHPDGAAKYREEILREFPNASVFFADRLHDEKTINELASLVPDLGISAWFGYILKKPLLDIFPCGVINTHNSYLPYNRGKFPQAWAIATGSKYGVTLHYVDSGIDTGDIIAQKEIVVKSTHTAGTLYDEALGEVTQLFRDTWLQFKSNTLLPMSQESADATHHFAREITALDVIDLDKTYTGREFLAQLRARSFRDRSYAYFVEDGKKIYVKVALAEDQYF